MKRGIALILSLFLAVHTNPAFAAKDEATTQPDKTVVIEVLTNDGLPAGTKVTKVEGAEHGKTEIISDSTRVLYTPTRGFVGLDHFIYFAGSGNGDDVSNIVTVNVGGNTAASTLVRADQITKTGSVLLLLLVLAILLESGLSVLFNWRPFLLFGESRGLKTPIAVATASVFVFSYDINAVEAILEAFEGKDLENTWPGQLITAFIVAGGSGLVVQIFEKFQLRNPLSRQQTVEQIQKLCRLKIVVNRKTVPNTQQILVKIGQSIVGSINPQKNSFGGMLGYPVPAGPIDIEISGIDENSNEVKTSKTETIAAGATVTLSMSI